MVFSVLGFFLYVVSNTEFIKQAREAIVTDGYQFTRWYEGGGIDLVKEKIEMRMQRGSDQVYLLVNNNDEKLAGMLDKWPEMVGSEFFDMQEVVLDDEDIHASWRRPPFIGYENIKIFIQTVTFADEHKLLIGRNLYVIERLRDLTGELALFALVVLGIILIVNIAISMFVVNSVNHIVNVTKQVIETGDLSARITVKSGWDDLSYLSKMINSLMDYIERLVDNIRQISNNIAHDLRSPLSRLQNRIDSLDENKPISAAEKQKLKAESDTLLSMFAAVLRISEIESGKHVFEKVVIDVSDLVDHVHEFFEPVASEKGIVLTKTLTSVKSFVDQDLLFQAMLNLMENAIKFTPKSGRIDLSVKMNLSGDIIINVSDTGIGIPVADINKVFRRFYRSDKSRTMPGNGLGLSMVKAIIDFHHGEIELADNQPGLVVTITLPHDTSI